ncbi:TPM domain-containing protein [Sphingobium yanoikuyae]|uniref:TPM domain-containing protein n=1 Tax=Sphingobium yanoikuyae TaxID=13690 RepID=UPI003B91D72E
MNRIALAACALAASCSANSPALAAHEFPDRGRAAVVDAAGIIPADRERVLNERIVSWIGSTGNQLVVATVPSLQGSDIADYGYRLGRHWGLGKNASSAGSTGVILLLAPNERKVRIEVGYGLEGTLTDAVTADILRRNVVPSLKAGDRVGALESGASAIMAASTASNSSRAPDHSERRWITPLIVATIALLLGLAALWIWLAARRAVRRNAALTARLIERGRVEEACRRDPSSFAVLPALTPRQFRKNEPRMPIMVPRKSASASPPAPSSPPPLRRQDDDYRPSTYTPPASDWSAPSSGWSSSDRSSNDSSSSSSSGFDSGGGSFGGGGSDSSY